MRENSGKMGRRQFIQKAGLGLTGALAAACQPIIIRVPRPAPALPPDPRAVTATPQPTPTPLVATATFAPEQISTLVSQEEAAFLAAHNIKDGDTSRPVVMMTYDDNAKYAQVRTILDAYNKYGVKATFFFLGEKITLSAKAVRAIVAEGHLLGCHGYEHISLLNLNEEQVGRQFSRCFDAVNEVVPGYRLRFVRFPYGEGNNTPWLLRAAAQWGLQHVHWSMGSGGLDNQTFANVMRNVCNGAVVLSHMFRPYDVSQAERIVAGLLENGYSLETLETGRQPRDVFQIS